MLETWAIIERDLRKYFRSPALMIVSLVLPLLQLVVIGNAIGGRITDVSVAVVDLDRGTEAVRVRERFRAVEANAKTFRVRFEDDVTRALQATKDGQYAATVVIPENYSRQVLQASGASLGLVVDNTDPFVVATLTQKMNELLEAIRTPDPTVAAAGRIALEVVEIFPYVDYIEYLLPGSITLAIFICTLIGGGILYVDDKSRGFHEGYLVTPISRLQLVLGMIISGTLKSTFAGVVITFLGSPIAGVAHRLNFERVLLLVGLNAIVSFALVNMVFMLMVRVRDPVVPRATFGLLNTFLFFPSGAMYPVSSFPDWLRLISKVDPFTYAVHGFRSVLLKNTGGFAIAGDVVFLAVFSVACFAAVFLLFPRRL